MKIEHKCRDYGEPGCLGDIDERYTMRFDDIGEEPIYWCSHCGPGAHALDQALTEFMMQGPEYVQKVKDTIAQIDCQHKKGGN